MSSYTLHILTVACFEIKYKLPLYDLKCVDAPLNKPI